MDKTNDELIASIHIDASNLNYIAKTGTINGTLLQELRRILDEKTKPHIERKTYIHKRLGEAEELLIKNGIIEPLIKHIPRGS